MEDFFKMDVFFVVATIATVVVTTLLVIALVYAVRFLRTLDRIGHEVEEEAVALRADIEEARSRVKSFRFAQLFPLLGKMMKRKASRKRRST